MGDFNNINFKNINLATKQVLPVISIVNGKKITFNHLGYNANTAVLMKLSGNRTKDIKLVNTDTTHAQQVAVFSAHAGQSALVKE